MLMQKNCNLTTGKWKQLRYILPVQIKSLGCRLAIDSLSLPLSAVRIQVAAG